MEARKQFVIALVFAFVGTFFLGSILLPESASAKTLFVGGAGPGNFTSIQNAIFAADPGDTVFVYNGTYYENIEIYKAISLVGEGRDNTTIDGSNSGDVVYVTGDWVNITGFTITASGWGYAGVYIYQANWTRIADSNISGNRMGVYLHLSHNGTVANNTLLWNSYDGIYVRESTHNHVSDNRASENRYGIYVSGSSNNTVTGNILSKNSNYGIYLSSSDGNTLSNNNASSNTQYGIFLQSSQHNVLLDNVGAANEFGVILYFSSDNTISRGTFSGNAFSGISSQQSSDNAMINTTVVSNGASGIYMYHSGNSVIFGNNATSNNYGITVQGSTAPNRIDQNVATNQERGIFVSDSENDLVEGNIVVGNEEGIYLGASAGIQVTGNNVSSNNMRGIYIDSSSGNLVTANNISNNGIGIYAYVSDDNLIYHNSIVNNLDQAYNNGGTSQWDVGYPFGGNYWSDYTGVDNMMGPDQDLPGSDGIGDEPYPIFLGNVDQYPLVNPPPLPLLLPSPPQNLQAWAGDEQVSLNWSPSVFDGHSNITGYNIYRGLAPGAEQFLVLLGTVLTYADTELSNGQTYYYQVSAVNEVNEGPRSNEANATPVGLPSCPENLQATADLSLINLTWEAPTSDGGSPITNYWVHRWFSSGGEIPYVLLGSVLSYTDVSVTPGETYYYQVSALNAIGEGPKSNETSARMPVPPSRPLNLEGAGGNQQVLLTWDPPANDGGSPILNYSIYRGNTSGGETHHVDVGNVTNYTDTGLKNGQMYFYRVRARNVVGEGQMSNEVAVRPATAPSEPQDLVAEAGVGYVNLSWSPPVLDGGRPVDGYRVYRGNSSGGETLLTDLGIVFQYTDHGVIEGQTYFYQVSAENRKGEGPVSNEANATVPTAPSHPENLSAIGGYREVALVWNPPFTDGGSPVTNYRVYRGTTPGGETFLLELGNVTDFLDVGLADGQEYFYQVSAVNIVGEGAKSNEANANTSLPPRPPANVTAFLSGGSSENITVTWSLSQDDGAGLGSVVGYGLYRSASYDPVGSGYVTLGAVLNGTSSFVDVLAGVGDANSYYYRVCAVDALGIMSFSGGQAGKLVRQLLSGPNLLSVPLILSNASIEHFLQTVEFDRARAYDASSGHWMSYMRGKPYLGDLRSIDHTMGVWVNVTADSNLTVAGAVPAQTTMQLRKGWNLVGFPSLNSSFTVADLKATVPVERVEAFDATAPPNFLRVLQDSDVLLAGHAYWVKVDQDTVWVVSN